MWCGNWILTTKQWTYLIIIFCQLLSTKNVFVYAKKLFQYDALRYCKKTHTRVLTMLIFQAVSTKSLNFFLLWFIFESYINQVCALFKISHQSHDTTMFEQKTKPTIYHFYTLLKTKLKWGKKLDNIVVELKDYNV